MKNNHSRRGNETCNFCLARLHLYREKDQADERELRRKERELWTLHTESRLRELHERERIHIDTIEEKRRERVRVTPSYSVGIQVEILLSRRVLSPTLQQYCA